jgi:two-component system, NtrC family, nitrogen regulation sensor histidine kinase NtrY
MSFETRIFWLAAAIALPALVALGIALYALDVSRGTWTSVGIGVGLATLVFAARLRNRVVFPLYTLSNLLEALREGDYSLRGTHARRGDAIGEVIWEVNALGQTLREGRLKVEETLALLTKVLGAIDIAIIAFDATQRLRLINPAGQRLLATTSVQAQGKTAEALGVADCLAVDTATTLRRAFPGAAGAFEVRRASFREGGLPHDLLVINDLSRALREEERQAWQRLIRVLGHELNNSLAPIKSMAATVLQLVGREPPPPDWRDDVRQALSVIGDRADALTRFMFGYTTLARLPPPKHGEVELVGLVRRVARLEQRQPVSVEAPEALVIEADSDQVEQALINLVKNAVDAALPLGGAVAIRVGTLGTEAVIEIVDEGPGLATSENLFVPFFTTKPGGSGIGLVLARQIAEAHGGRMTLVNRHGARGCIARLTLPLRAEH